MTLYENLLTAFILFGLFVLGYLKMKKITLMEMIQELKNIFSEKKEDIDLKW